MEQLMEYIKPELVVVAIFLSLLGKCINKSKVVNNKWIPSILGLVGVGLCALWVMATTSINGIKDILMALFVSIVQGGLVAGLSVYVDQLFKQAKK